MIVKVRKKSPKTKVKRLNADELLINYISDTKARVMQSVNQARQIRNTLQGRHET